MSNFKIVSLISSPKFKMLRHNLLYVVALALFIFLAVSFLPQRLLIYSAQKQKLDDLNAEIAQQEKRLQAIQSVNIEDLHQLLLILNTLYPQQEDQFSIYPAIDNLQAVTGLTFTKKSSPFVGDQSGPISMTLNATGTTEQIRSFLQNYLYKSARILTLNSMSIQSGKIDNGLWEIGLAVSFHAKEINAGTAALTAINPEAITFAREVEKFFKSKGAQFSVISIKDEDIPLDYPIKTNPFNQ